MFHNKLRPGTNDVTGAAMPSRKHSFLRTAWSLSPAELDASTPC